MSPREKARAGTRGERESKGRGQGQGVNAVGVRGCSYSVRLDRLGSAWIGMDPGLGWKPAHTGVSAHVDAELRIWLTPGWSQTRLNHVNPREREISSPEAGTLLPQHATLPALPTRRRGQRHRSHLKKVCSPPPPILVGLIPSSLPFYSAGFPC